MQIDSGCRAVRRQIDSGCRAVRRQIDDRCHTVRRQIDDRYGYAIVKKFAFGETMSYNK